MSESNEKNLNLPKRNTNLPRQPSGGFQKQLGLIANAG